MPRLTGKLGSVYLAGSGTKIADIYNWELDIEVEMADCGIKGERHQQYVPGSYTSRVRAERYVTNGLSLAQLARTHGEAAGSGGSTITFELQGVNGSLGSPGAGPVVTGEGFVMRGQVRTPRGLIQDTLEIQCISVTAA